MNSKARDVKEEAYTFFLDQLRLLIREFSDKNSFRRKITFFCHVIFEKDWQNLKNQRMNSKSTWSQGRRLYYFLRLTSILYKDFSAKRQDPILDECKNKCCIVNNFI